MHTSAYIFLNTGLIGATINVHFIYSAFNLKTINGGSEKYSSFVKKNCQHIFFVFTTEIVEKLKQIFRFTKHYSDSFSGMTQLKTQSVK